MIFQEMISVERRALVGLVCGLCAGQRSVTGFPVPRYPWPSHGSTSPVMPANALSNSAHSGEKRAQFTKFEPEARLAFSCGQLLLAWHPPCPFTHLFFPLICCEGNQSRKLVRFRKFIYSRMKGGGSSEKSNSTKTKTWLLAFSLDIWPAIFPLKFGSNSA